MDRFGLPLGCLLLGLALAGVVTAMALPCDAAVWAGVGAAAVLGYAGVMAVHRFERSGGA
jgi:hypothetical protein